MMKITLILFLCVSCNVLADQEPLNIEPLARANINCAAFYTAAQIIIRPEAKKEYESKMSAHYALSHQLSSSYELLAKILNSEIQKQAEKISSLKEREQAASYLSSNHIKCSTIEVNSAGVVQQNSAKQKITRE
jgi:hypothetical protein